MTFMGRFPMDQTQLLGVKLAPTTQTQQSGQPWAIFVDRTIRTPIDGATFTSGGVTVRLYLSQQDPSAIVQQLNSAGIPCTIDRNGILLLTGTDFMPTSSDPNLLIALGFAPGNELREDNSLELREDTGKEYRDGD
jgi:hypothetical protein